MYGIGVRRTRLTRFLFGIKKKIFWIVLLCKLFATLIVHINNIQNIGVKLQTRLEPLMTKKKVYFPTPVEFLPISLWSQTFMQTESLYIIEWFEL